MDVMVIAGLSKGSGAQFSLSRTFRLSKNGKAMSYPNLQKHFGLEPAAGLSDYNTPSLAGIYLYNYLSKRGISCGLINFLDLEMKQFETLLQQNPKVIALSTTYLPSIKAVKGVTQIIRQYAPDTKIILGGPLVHNSYLLYKLKDTDYDTASCAQMFFFINPEKAYYQDIDLFVVEEQGEATLWQVVRAIKNCRDYSEIPNLAYYKNDQLIFTARKPENNPFTEDLVCWDEVPEEYIYPFSPIRGSRGCPHKCKYCNFAPGRAFHLKSPDILAQEIAAMADTGKIRMLRFTDDNLFLTRKRVEDNCRKIIEVGKGLKWTSFIRASSITKDNIQLLKDSGCVLAQIGMESGDASILKEMDKKDTPEHYKQVIELLNSHGISSQLYFIIGFPGETEQTIENSIQLINQFQHQGPAINEVAVFPFLLAPLAPVYTPENRKKYNLKGAIAQWSHYSMNSEQTRKLALDFFFSLENVYPPYGIEEFGMVEIPKLKRVAQLRSKIRRAEVFQGSPQVIDRTWQELKEVVLAA